MAEALYSQAPGMQAGSAKVFLTPVAMPAAAPAAPTEAPPAYAATPMTQRQVELNPAAKGVCMMTLTLLMIDVLQPLYFPMMPVASIISILALSTYIIVSKQPSPEELQARIEKGGVMGSVAKVQKVWFVFVNEKVGRLVDAGNSTMTTDLARLAAIASDDKV